MRKAQDNGVHPATGLGVGILASALLALLTCSVFYLLQDYGPESAIRKYNQAILQGDYAELNQVSSQPVNSPPGQWLYQVVRDFQEGQGRLALIGMDRQPTYVVADLAFVRPDGRKAYMPLVVTKENHVWKVNPSETYGAYRRMLGTTYSH